MTETEEKDLRARLQLASRVLLNSIEAHRLFAELTETVLAPKSPEFRIHAEGIMREAMLAGIVQSLMASVKGWEATL